jgi:hypothetical protein
MIACSKAHYKDIRTLVNGKDRDNRGTWDNDALEATPQVTSLSILIDWWATEPNYNKYCGKNTDGAQKSTVANALALEMQQKTTSKDRTGKQVQSKITHVEKAFRSAYQYATSVTGAGLKAGDPASFEEKLNQKCPFYFTLEPIMMDRAGTEPRVTNEDPIVLDVDVDNEDQNQQEKEQDFGALHSDDKELSMPPLRQPTQLSNFLQADDGDEDQEPENAEPPLRQSSQLSQARGVSQLTQPSQSTTMSSDSGSTGNVIQKMAALTGAATSVASSKKGTVASVKKRKNNPLIDDEAMSILEVINRCERDKMREIRRHNKFLESMEERRLRLQEQQLAFQEKQYELSGFFKEKNAELEYKANLLNKYEMFKERGFTSKQIMAIVPEMQQILDIMGKESEEE